MKNSVLKCEGLLWFLLANGSTSIRVTNICGNFPRQKQKDPFWRQTFTCSMTNIPHSNQPMEGTGGRESSFGHIEKSHMNKNMSWIGCFSLETPSRLHFRNSLKHPGGTIPYKTCSQNSVVLHKSFEDRWYKVILPDLQDECMVYLRKKTTPKLCIFQK